MNETVVKEVLDAIHIMLKNNGFAFTLEQISSTDDFIIPFISELGIDSKEFNVEKKGVPRLVNDKRIIPIFIRYFALIEDNKELYEKLEKEDYVFYENHVIKFYALDRLLSAKFDIDEYIRLLNEYGDVVFKFYASIRGLDLSEKEFCCREFSDIIHRDYTTLKVGYDDADENSNYNFLTSHNILLFGKDFLLSLNRNQREMINNININLTDEEALKIKELYTKFPKFSGNISMSSGLLKYFSIDEISTMTMKDSILYEEAINVGLLDRMRNILSLNPDFNCTNDFINPLIFDICTDEEISKLSTEGKKEAINIMNSCEDNFQGSSKRFRKIITRDAKRKKKANVGK